MKDLVDNDLNIGDNCYYIMDSESGWSLSVIKIVELKPKTVIGMVVNTNPSASHTHKNHGGNYYLVVRSDFKNYGGEVEKFFDWIRQYLQQDYYKTFIGYSLYEEAIEPTLYYVEGYDL